MKILSDQMLSDRQWVGRRSAGSHKHAKHTVTTWVDQMLPESPFLADPARFAHLDSPISYGQRLPCWQVEDQSNIAYETGQLHKEGFEWSNVVW
jgi:hypothetical protein